MPDHNPLVCIVIVHLANEAVLADCLKSCSQIDYPNCRIIVVVNGTDSHANLASLRQLFQRVFLIRSPENVGYARANNLGIRKALEDGADYILLLNDDTIVSPDFLKPLIQEEKENPRAGMVGPKILYAGEPDLIWFAGGYLDGQRLTISTPGSNEQDRDGSGRPFESDYITGCALLISAEVIGKIGLLDKRFFLYWEDVDWGLRAKKAGLKNMVVPSSRIWHKVSVSSGGVDSLVRIYHKTRSRFLLARLHAPASLPRLHCAVARDLAWLLLKSHDVKRFRKARAYMTAIGDYYRGRTDKGPDWIWAA